MSWLLYEKISSPFRSRPHRLGVDVFVTATAGYFTLKKELDISITRSLEEIFMPSSAHIMMSAAIFLVAYASLMKVLLLILDAVPATRIKAIPSDGMSHCCLRINDEIAKHISAVQRDPTKAKQTFPEHHNFEVNVGLVVDSMHSHIVSTLAGAHTRDIFVSVYLIPDFENLNAPRRFLNYLTHQPIRRDVIETRSIDTQDPKYKDYECVRCVKSSNVTHLKPDCSDYEKSKSKRHKSIKHYIGMKLLSDNVLLGFLNIEIYNSNFFSSEDQMAVYVEQHLLQFKYLLEYQLLKKTFFFTMDSHGILK